MAMKHTFVAKGMSHTAGNFQMKNRTADAVAILVEKGHKINCFGLVSRTNEFHWATTEQNIDSFFY